MPITFNVKYIERGYLDEVHAFILTVFNRVKSTEYETCAVIQGQIQDFWKRGSHV